MTTLIYIASFLALLGVLVTIHEYMHRSLVSHLAGKPTRGTMYPYQMIPMRARQFSIA